MRKDSSLRLIFSVGDTDTVQADLVVTTEKDAGKLASFLAPGDPWWALRLSADVIQGREALRRLVLTTSREAAPEACA